MKPFACVFVTAAVGRFAVTKNSSHNFVLDPEPFSNDSNVDRLVTQSALPHRFDDMVFPPVEGFDFPTKDSIEVKDDFGRQVAHTAAIVQADIPDQYEKVVESVSDFSSNVRVE